MSSSLGDIKDQEDDIFKELGSYDFSEAPKFAKGSPRDKALQQLAVSEDSPFSTKDEDFQLSLAELKKSRKEKAALIKEEAEIKRQIELVKRRLSELKLTREKQQQQNNDEKTPKITVPIDETPKVVVTDEKLKNQLPSSSSVTTLKPNNYRLQKSQIHQQNRSSPSSSIVKHHHHRHHLYPKFRPLTGKADCPNCTCDRRNSVCDKCIDLVNPIKFDGSRKNSSKQYREINNRDKLMLEDNQSSTSTSTSSGSTKSTSYNAADERPIRPAKETKFLATVESVEDKIVPGKVYTIIKSLNGEKTRLAQAREELQNLTEQVKKKDIKIDQYLKLLQLYKEQWKYGPSIGGPSASLREKLGTRKGNFNNRNYESRLDPDLARDSKSLMGFQHIESAMKLRQYNNTTTVKSTTTTSRQQTVNKSSSVSRPTTSHPRSKSLESLTIKSIPPSNLKSFTGRSGATSKSGALHNHQRPNVRFQDGKSASEINLYSSREKDDSEVSSFKGQDDGTDDENNEVDDSADEKGSDADDSKKDDDDDDDDDDDEMGVEKVNVEEVTDRDPIVNQSRTLSSSMQSVAAQQTTSESAQQTRCSTSGEKIQKMTWIPVFGETEIKTVKRAAPKRKVQIIQKSGSSNSLNVMGGSNNYNNVDNRQLQMAKNTFARKNVNLPTKNNQQQASQKRQQQQQKPKFGYAIQARGSCNNDRIMVEAERKLKFVSDLLDKEKRDFIGKNQLIINRSVAPPPVPKPRRVKTSPIKVLTFDAPSTSPQQQQRQQQQQQQQQQESQAQNNQVATIKEIARLEEMLKEQQKLLAKLTMESHQEKQHPQIAVSPITVRCSSPCCHQAPHNSPCIVKQHQSTVPKKSLVSAQHHGRTIVAAHGIIGGGGLIPGTNKLLINTIRRTKSARVRSATRAAVEEEREKQQVVDSSIMRKQSDLEMENKLLKQSLSKCVETCFKDISSTVGPFVDSSAAAAADSINATTPNEPSASATNIIENDKMAAAGDYSQSLDGNNNGYSTVLTNAAQLIVDSRHIKQMKDRIEFTEQQRKGLFEELSKEKQQSNQLKMQLRQCQDELNKLMEVKRKLESQAAFEGSSNQQQQQQQLHLTTSTTNCEKYDKTSQQRASDVNVDGRIITSSDTTSQPSTSAAAAAAAAAGATTAFNPSSSSQMVSSDLEDSSSYNDIDLYRQFIQSMSPDIESMRRARKEVMNDIENLKSQLKMLTNIDQNNN